MKWLFLAITLLTIWDWVRKERRNRKLRAEAAKYWRETGRCEQCGGDCRIECGRFA